MELPFLMGERLDKDYEAVGANRMAELLHFFLACQNQL